MIGYSAWRKVRKPVLSSLGLLALLCASYWWGTQRTERVSVPVEECAPATREGDGECKLQLEQCLQREVNLSKGAEIDADALAQARREVALSRTRLERLEQEATLYRSLIDGTVRTTGVTAHSLEITGASGGQEPRYRYRLTFIQRAGRQVELQGFATITLVGTEGGKARRLGLHELTGQQSDRRLPLKFVYFQTLEGEFSLPVGFQPSQVRVQAEIRSGTPQKAERTFDWHLMEE
jgi:hypothetical protein